MSIAEALRDAGVTEIAFAGRENGLEGRVVPPMGWRFWAIQALPLRRSLAPAALVALLRTLRIAYGILREFAPDVVVATGGYVAAGVVLANTLRRGKTVIHEQNAVPGRTNRWLARWAKRVCITFERTSRYFNGRPCVHTGLPVRRDLLQARTERASAHHALGLDQSRQALFVIGGSQGARTLNQWTLAMLPELRKMGIQVIHQVGERNVPEFDRYIQEADYRWFGFMNAKELGQVMSAADLVVSRAGASTLNEVALFGRPAILIPYPHAYADHQWHNAQEMTEYGGVVTFRESEMDVQKLLVQVMSLLDNPDKLREMGETNRRWAKEDAAQRVVEQIMEVAS